MSLTLRAGLTVLQVALLVAVAPLVNGLIKKIKARFQRRVGPPLAQVYRDLAKLLCKESVHARPTSSLFRLAPAVSLGAAVVATTTFPCFVAGGGLAPGDVVTGLYLLGLGRFFTALAGLDAASAFGGLGSSRDVSIAALAEPVAVVALLALAAGVGGPTDGASLAAAPLGALAAPWRLLAALAFFLVTLAECARVPVDNPATHLELTMIHEAMLLEYSGPELACATLAAQVKQTLLLSMLATLFFPVGLATAATPVALAVAAASLAGKLVLLAVIVAVVESGVAKLRLFRVPDLLGAAVGLALLAYIAREAL